MADTAATYWEQLDILRTGAEVVIGDNVAVRLSAKLPIFRRIDRLVQARFRHFWRVFEIFEQFLFAGVHDFDFDVFPEIGAVHQKFERSPCRLTLLLYFGVVHDGIQLGTQLLVDLGDKLVDQQRWTLCRPSVRAR